VLVETTLFIAAAADHGLSPAMVEFLNYLVIGLANGMIIALIAIGYTMVYGIIELINFAHGDLCTLGAFLALTIIGALGLEQWSGAAGWMAVLLLLFGAAGFCAGLNWCINRAAYQPLRRAPKLTLLVTAIGMSFILVNVALFWGGLPMTIFGGGNQAAAPKHFPSLVTPDNLLGEDALVQITARELLVVGVTIPLMIALTWLVRFTRLGKSMRAVAQNPIAASLMGIDVDRVIGAAFVIGGALGGFGIVVYSIYNGSISFQMGYRTGMDAFTAAVLGGIGSLPGAVLGGMLIGLLRAFSDGYLETRWTPTVVFAVLILVLIFRPSGLLGTRVREKV